MGGCLSKKESTTSAAAVATTPLPDPPSKPPNKLEEEKKKTPTTTTTTTTTATTTTAQTEEGVKKKEVFVIKQRKSHERRLSEDKIKNLFTNTTPVVDKEPSQSSSSSGDVVVVVNGGGGGASNNGGNGSILVGGGSGAPVRTSSCTKEEVDAILIQCGRLSRSSSGNRKYSGSKRSYDFDHDNNEKGDDAIPAVANENRDHHHRHSRSSHRRTPSREKDVDSSSKRSGSRDRYSSSREEERGGRSNGGGSKRVSRSPGRRSETPTSATTTSDKAQRPGKMVSVPASVATTRGDKSGGGDSGTATGVKRVSVKRSGGEVVGHRTTAASPRSQSPANVRASNNENNNNAQHQQQPGHSLSRNSSRKAEHSPYRRNAMAEIDDNCLKSEALKSQDHKVPQKLKETEQGLTKKLSHLQSQQKSDGRQNRVTEPAPVTNIVEDPPIEEAKGGHSQKASRVAAGGGGGGGGAAESLKPQGITRSRSSRMSRDLDLNLGLDPDTVLNPTSYASLLLEDIQNFHQQKNTPAAAAAPTAFSLPACVTKACSILDAVADLNSCAGSNISSTFSNEDRCCFETDRSNNSNNNKNFNKSTNVVPFNPLGKKRLEMKDPFVESELVVDDDLMEPSLHKYITVRRGINIMPGGGEKEMEQQESSGSNSYVGGQPWVSSSSSWEPNSADSTDRWTSRSNTGGEEEPSLLVPEKQQQQTISATPMRRKRETGGRGQMTIPIAAASM